MADDSHGMGIPLPPDATKIHEFPGVTRLAMERVAEILAGGMTPGMAAAAVAAVAAELETADVVMGDDPGIMRETSAYGNDFATAGVDAAGNFIEGYRHSGARVYAALEILNAATTEVYPTHPNIKGSVDAAGNMIEDHLDENGKVPQWMLDAWATRMATGSATPMTYLFQLIGQSNIWNKSDYLEEPADIEDAWVTMWDRATQKFRPIRADETFLGLYFGQAWVRRHRGTKVALIPSAEPDTGFDLTRPGGTWTRTDTTNPVNLFNRAISEWNAGTAALTAAGVPFVKAGALWSQGEADSRTMNQAQYAAAFDDLVGAYRTATGQPKCLFVVGSLTPELFFEYEPPLPAGVNDALRDTPRRLTYTAFVQAPNDYAKRNERVHYSVAGQRVRGALFVEAVRQAKVNITTSRPITPPGLTVRRSGTEVLIGWTAPECRVTAYALKVSTDYGVTWTDEALAAPLATGHTLTAAAGTPVWARVAAVNDQGTSYYSIPYHG